jgi:hypothetical protein
MLPRALLIVALVWTAGASAAAPAPPSARLGDVVRLRMTEGQLRLEWLPRTSPPVKGLPLAGPEGRWELRAPQERPGVAAGTLHLERTVGGARDKLGFWSIFVSSSPQRLYITGLRGGRIATETTLHFTQTADGAVHLVVQNGADRTFTQARAASLLELRSRHPGLVRQFLVPLLRQISTEDPLLPGPTEVYQVFSDISPDSTIAREVSELLPALADPDFQKREKASRALSALGPPVVCALLRLEQEDLLPEQQVRIGRLLEAGSHRAIGESAQERRDPAFLADCMEFADDRVRILARTELERLLGQPIPMHRAPTAAEWSAAADLVRARLLP